MKAFGAIWTLGWVLVVFGGVRSDSIGYPGRGALLAYNPARGEFPVQSLFGSGYFSYIDDGGNSRIINLEPNPLLGVRVSASGSPQIESGRNIDLGKQVKDEQVNKVVNLKADRLKPIKEFDENPFVDSLDQRELVQSSTTAPDSSMIVFGSSGPSLLDSNKDSLSFMPTGSIPDGQEERIFLYLPPTPTVPEQDSPAPADGTARQGIFNPQNPFLPPLNTGAALPNPLRPVSSGTILPILPTSINMRPVVLNPSLPAGLGQVFPTPNPLPSTIVPTLPPPTTSDIIFPNSPLLSGITNPPAPATASPILSVLSGGNPFLPSSPPAISPTVFPIPTPSPSSSNPFLQSSNIKPPWTAPAVARPTPQFKPDMNNPFLPSLGRVEPTPDSPTVTSEDFPLIDIKSLLQPSTSPLETSPTEQVKDTPEVEQAKREHFLAHELALARLETTRQPDESLSPLASTSDSSSVYLMTDAASSQAVTSGPSTAAIAEQTKIPVAEADGATQVLPVV